MKKKKIFFALLVLILFISLLGLSNFQNHYLTKQVVWIVFGLGFFFLFKKFNINILLKYSLWIYIFNVFLLILVLLIGKEINGSKAWFSLGFGSFQPSELMKISLSLLYFKILLDKKNNSLLLLVKIVILGFIPSILVFLEPDTGAIIMYLIIMLVALFSSKIKKVYLWVMILLGLSSIIIFVVLYFYHQDVIIKLLGTSIFYRIDRIIHFKNNYQLSQALIYIGSAGLTGHKNTLYIPEAHTDFIFSFLIGRYGIILGFIIILCYFIMDLILINNSRNNYLLKTFMCLFIYSQIENILMNIGLFPIMGIPLPFLSYGGTNTIILFMFLGIITNKKARLVI